MVRSKMLMKLIDGEKRRNTTFMKRRVGIKKKARELATLCDIPILLVCFGPEGQVDTWPENQQDVYDIINKYRNLNNEDRGKRKSDLSSFFKEQIRKLIAELDQMCKNHQLDDMSESSLQELDRLLETKLEDIEERIQILRGQDSFEGRQHVEHNVVPLHCLQNVHQGDMTLDNIFSDDPKQGFVEASDGNGFNGVALCWHDGDQNNMHHSPNTCNEINAGNNESLEGDRVAIIREDYSNQNHLQFLVNDGNITTYNVPNFTVPYMMPYDHRNIAAMQYYGAVPEVFNPYITTNAQVGGYPYDPKYCSMQQYANGPISGSFDLTTSFTSLGSNVCFGNVNDVSNVHMRPLPECCFHNSRFNMLEDHVLLGNIGSSSNDTSCSDNRSNNNNSSKGVSYNMMYHPTTNNEMSGIDQLLQTVANSWSSSILCSPSSGAIMAATPVSVFSGGTPRTNFGSNPNPQMKP